MVVEIQIYFHKKTNKCGWSSSDDDNNEEKGFESKIVF